MNNTWFKQAKAAISRLIREPIIAERRRYPTWDPIWLDRGTGPRQPDWLGIF